MTGYVRQDVGNNIENNEIADATFLDQEYDAIQAAFNSSTGHNHDGTTGEGAPITVIGPGQDIIVSSSLVRPKTTDTYDLGSSTFKFKDIYISGNLVATSGISGKVGIPAGTVGAPGLYIVGSATTGIWSAATNELSFATSGANRINITSAGNVTMTKTLTVTEGITSGMVITADSFSGDLNAADITTGTVPSARMVGNYTNITGVGVLNAGSIGANFGAINVGADPISGGNFTAAGYVMSDTFTSSGTTTILATNSTGTIRLRPNGGGSTTGQMSVLSDGGVSVTGDLTVAGTITGSVAASNLTGTIGTARISGTYTGITQVGALTELQVDNIIINGGQEIYNSVATNYVRMSGGNAASAGGSMYVFGQDHTTNPGHAIVDSLLLAIRNLNGSTTYGTFNSSGLLMGTNMALTWQGTGAATTRTNLGLGTMATQDTGTTGSNFRTNTQNDARFLQVANNLSDVTAATARTNLGLSTMALQAAGTAGSQFRTNTQNDARFHISGSSTLASGDLPTDSSAVDWVRLRTADVTHGQIGTYAMLRTIANSGAVTTGSNVAGNTLYYSSASDDNATVSPSGTWKCMGYIPAGAGSAGQRTTLFVRVS